MAVVCCIVFQVETFLFVMVVVSIFLVLTTELINTALEAAVDLFCGNQKHPLAKKAKDAAAAAVLMTAFHALIIALVVAFSVVRRYV